MHSKDKLAEALKKADLHEMAKKAEEGYYHDFLSSLPDPAMALDRDLLKAGTPAALAIRARHHNGDFDATHKESEDWIESDDGKEAMSLLIKPHETMGIRLAMRVEGDFWKAYYAKDNTMEGAVLLGSILMSAVQKKKNKDAFMSMMQDVVSDVIESLVGTRPNWDEPHLAPESEK